MVSPAVSASKDELRAQFRAYRRSLDEASKAARSGLIVHRAVSLAAIARAEVVHVYWPLGDRGEVDTRPLIAALRSWGTQVVLPVMTSFDPDTPTLEHRCYTGPHALETNRWGVREPVNTECLSAQDLDAVIVPALGADQNGHRIGYGAGYYDAFLEPITCPRIALVYDACFIPSVPNASHDVPVSTVVTERGIHSIDD